MISTGLIDTSFNGSSVFLYLSLATSFSFGTDFLARGARLTLASCASISHAAEIS